jgi:hypothetical protein
MSGMAYTSALAQAALQASAAGATAAGAQAAQNLSTVVAAQTERMRIAAQLAMGQPGSGGGGGGAGAREAENVSEEGARANYARDLDQRLRGALINAVGGQDGTGSDSSSSEMMTEGPPPLSQETALFHRQTGGVAEDSLKELIRGGYAGPGGSGSGTGTTYAKGKKRKIQVVVLFYVDDAEEAGVVGSLEPKGKFKIDIADTGTGKDPLVTKWETVTSGKLYEFTSASSRFIFYVNWWPYESGDPASSAADPYIRFESEALQVPAKWPAKKTAKWDVLIRLPVAKDEVMDADAQTLDQADLDRALASAGIRRIDLINLPVARESRDAQGNVVAIVFDVIHMAKTATIRPVFTG